MSYVARGLTKAETTLLASIPGLPAEVLAILAEAGEAKAAAPRVVGPEPGEWFRATAQAFETIQERGVDYRWGREMRRVRVPASWVLYRDRTGKVKVGNREQTVPEAGYFPGLAFPAGVVDLGSARRA